MDKPIQKAKDEAIGTLLQEVELEFNFPSPQKTNNVSPLKKTKRICKTLQELRLNNNMARFPNAAGAASGSPTCQPKITEIWGRFVFQSAIG